MVSAFLSPVPPPSSGSWSAFSVVTFFLAKQEKVTCWLATPDGVGFRGLFGPLLFESADLTRAAGVEQLLLARLERLEF